MPIDDGQVSAGACPTQEMVDAYEVLNIDGSESTPLLDLANPYSADGSLNISRKPGLRLVDCSDKMYLGNRDPRFYATIYYDGVTVQLENSEYEVEAYVGGNCGLSPVRRPAGATPAQVVINVSSASQSSTSRRQQGQLYPDVSLWPNSTSNFAKAAYRAHGADWRGSGRRVLEMEEGMTVKQSKLNTYGTPMSAREAVNAVRAVSGCPGGRRRRAFWLRLCSERRVELAFEHRFFDVRRWTAPRGDLSNTDRRVTGMRIEVERAEGLHPFLVRPPAIPPNSSNTPSVVDSALMLSSRPDGRNWQNDRWAT